MECSSGKGLVAEGGRGAGEHVLYCHRLVGGTVRTAEWEEVCEKVQMCEAGMANAKSGKYYFGAARSFLGE